MWQFKVLLLGYLLLISVSAMGKGLENIKPDSIDGSTTSVQDETDSSEKLQKPDAKPSVDPAMPGDPVEKGIVEKKDSSEPVAAGKGPFFLENRAYILAGFGFVNLTGSKGSWSNRGAANIGAGYKIVDDFFKDYPLYLLVDYSAIPSSVVYRETSQRVITHAISGGALTRRTFNRMPSIVADLNLSLSYLWSRIKYTDRIDESRSALEKGSVVLKVGGGFDWKVVDNFSIGCGLTLGAGGYQTSQFMLRTNFHL